MTPQPQKIPGKTWELDTSISIIATVINVLICLVSCRSVYFTSKQVDEAKQANKIAKESADAAKRSADAAEKYNGILTNAGNLTLDMPANPTIGITRAEYGGNFSDKLLLSFNVQNDGQIDRTPQSVTLTLKDKNNNQIFFKPHIQIENKIRFNGKDKGFNPLYGANLKRVFSRNFTDPFPKGITTTFKDIVFTPFKQDNGDNCKKYAGGMNDKKYCFQIRKTTVEQNFAAKIDINALKKDKDKKEVETISSGSFCIKIEPDFEPKKHIINENLSAEFKEESKCFN